jgi:hypothetical protein
MKEKIKGIHSKLEYITIENITKVSEIYYVKTLTDLFVQNYEKDRKNYSPWVLRLELDYEALVIKNLSIDYIEKNI